MSADLQWLLIRKWNSFMRPATNGPVFSAEKVRNLDRKRTRAATKWTSAGREGLYWAEEEESCARRGRGERAGGRCERSMLPVGGTQVRRESSEGSSRNCGSVEQKLRPSGRATWAERE